MQHWMMNRSADSDQHAQDIYLTSVIGRRGLPYACPDISAVDRHIGWLYRQIKDRRLARFIQEFWADIDLLLERRMFLELDLQVSDAAWWRQ